MKTKVIILTVLAVLAFSASSVLAQEKGATRLMKLNTVQDLQQVEAGDTILMSCPKCKDIYATVVVKPLKGMQPAELKQVVKHLCPNCTTSIKTVGTGKNAKEKLVHTCDSCGSTDVNCCVIKKNSGPTAGMQENK